MEKILVTGGAGYIGSILVESLLQQGYHVIVYDNFMFKQNSLNHLCHNTNLSIISGDIRQSLEIKPIIKKVDVIFPLAAYVGAPLCKKDPVGAETTNLDGTLRFLNLCSKSQIIIMPTTNSAYGSGNSDHYCDENSPLNPISNYARQKIIVEEKLLERENSISLRLATVFGMSPRMRMDLLVNDFTWRAVKDRFIVLFESHFKRNFIHVRDVTRAFEHCLLNFDKMKGEVYNVGLSSANISKKDLCYKIKTYLPSFVIEEASFAKDPDQRNYIVSNDKINKTGFYPKYNLDFGIQELIKGYQMIQAAYSNI